MEKRGGNKRGSKKNVTVKSKKNEKGDEDDEAEEDEEGEEIYLIENEKTDDDKEEKTSADVTKSSMTRGRTKLSRNRRKRKDAERFRSSPLSRWYRSYTWRRLKTTTPKKTA